MLELQRYDMRWSLRFVPRLPSLLRRKETHLDPCLVAFLREQLDRPVTKGTFVEMGTSPSMQSN